MFCMARAATARCSGIFGNDRLQGGVGEDIVPARNVDKIEGMVRNAAVGPFALAA
jgi:hypothetical protein